MTDLETPEGFHARVAAATDDEGRLPVAIEAMPGWDIFPFELDGLRIKPLNGAADSRARTASPELSPVLAVPGSGSLARLAIAG